MQPECPGGYKQGADGYCYKFHPEKINWQEAQSVCKQDGGNLAIIFDQKTRDVVRGFMSFGWIGHTDQWQEGKWQTPSKGDAPYTSWRAGEPNNYGGNQDCAIQDTYKYWDDYECVSTHPFICQVKPGDLI